VKSATQVAERFTEVAVRLREQGAVELAVLLDEGCQLNVLYLVALFNLVN